MEDQIGAMKRWKTKHPLARQREITPSDFQQVENTLSRLYEPFKALYRRAIIIDTLL